mgnify:CR=1 FL=1
MVLSGFQIIVLSGQRQTLGQAGRDMDTEQKTETGQAGALPQSIEEAIDAYAELLAARRVPINARKHFVRWVSEFDGYRVSTLRRSFRTCNCTKIC